MTVGFNSRIAGSQVLVSRMHHYTWDDKVSNLPVGNGFIFSRRSTEGLLSVTAAWEPGRAALAWVANMKLAGGPVVTSRHLFTVDALGRRTKHRLESDYASILAERRERNWTYNSRGELNATTVTDLAGTPQEPKNESYRYDQIGNRLWHAGGLADPVTPGDTPPARSGVRAYAGNNLNQYTSLIDYGAAATNLHHDAYGNFIDDGWRTIVWDAENRLVEIHPKAGNSGERLEFRHDFHSRRVQTIRRNQSGASLGG